MALTLGIDIGTSSVKASIFDSSRGVCVASSPAPKQEIPRFVPQAGWCEQDPDDWWAATIEAIKSLPPELVVEVSAIGLAYQMHGLVLVDNQLSLVRRALIWSDSRAVDSGKKLLDLASNGLLERTLNAPGNFTLSKMQWVREHEPEAFSRAKFFMLPGDFIALKLSGKASTTSTGVSEMAGWDFGKSEVASDVVELAGGEDVVLPDLVPNFGEQGTVSKVASALTGLKVGIPITYRAGDQPNNAFSLNVLAPGEVAATAGTSGVLYGVTDTARLDSAQRVNTFLHVNSTEDAPRLGVLLCLNGTGASYSWLRRILGAHDFEELNGLVSQSPIGANGAKFLPFGNGAERLLENQTLGAELNSIDLNVHSRTDVARAVMEGIACSFGLGFRAMRDVGVDPKLIKAGRANMFLSDEFSQMVADLLGVPIELYNTDGSLGAARGAAFGAGFARDFESVFLGLEVVKRFEPVAANVAEYGLVFDQWLRSLDARLRRS